MHRRQVGLIPWPVRRKRTVLFALCSFLAFYQQLLSLRILSTPSKFIAGVNAHPVFVESVPCTKSDDLPTEKWCFDRNNDPHYLWNSSSASEDIAVDSSQRLNTTFTSNETVKIMEFTHAGFEKCLANKTIIFVGDSRVRYQFLHLASYLKRAQFMKCEDDHNKASAEPDEECLLLDYRKSSSWSAWYNESTRMISDTNNINVGNHTQTDTMKHQQQYALCDCARPDKRGIQNHYFENRYVQRKGAFGTIQLVGLTNWVNLVQIEEGFPPILFQSEMLQSRWQMWPMDRCSRPSMYKRIFWGHK